MILGEEQYNTAIDIWSVGCVVAEMFLGEPIFPGNSSKDQLLKIMQILGTPTTQEVTEMCKKSKAKLPQIQAPQCKLASYCVIEKLTAGDNMLRQLSIFINI